MKWKREMEKQDTERDKDIKVGKLRETEPGKETGRKRNVKKRKKERNSNQLIPNLSKKGGGNCKTNE